MTLDGTVHGRDETGRRYVVTCDDCSFEETAHGVEKATGRATDHRDSTDHQVLVLEVPATS